MLGRRATTRETERRKRRKGRAKAQNQKSRAHGGGAMLRKISAAPQESFHRAHGAIRLIRLYDLSLGRGNQETEVRSLAQTQHNTTNDGGPAVSSRLRGGWGAALARAQQTRSRWGRLGERRRRRWRSWPRRPRATGTTSSSERSTCSTPRTMCTKFRKKYSTA
jgi:hypothetical protein